MLNLTDSAHQISRSILWAASLVADGSAGHVVISSRAHFNLRATRALRARGGATCRQLLLTLFSALDKKQEHLLGALDFRFL